MGWTERYEDPIVVEERKQKKLLTSGNDGGGGEKKKKNSPSSSTSTKSALWTPGYGTGGSGESTSNEKGREKMLLYRMQRTVKTLECFASFLEISTNYVTKFQNMKESDWSMFRNIIDASPVLRVFMSYLF